MRSGEMWCSKRVKQPLSIAHPETRASISLAGSIFACSKVAEAKLEMPPDQRPILGGRRGHHSEHLGHLLAVMQFLPRTYPDAVW